MSRLTRRRSTPWIHQWSRPLMAAVAAYGIAVTSYLTYEKLTGGTVACSADPGAAIRSCDVVLSSPYATVFGLPLSLWGLVAYLFMGIMALAPYAINPDNNKPLRATVESWTWLLLFMGGTVMISFSAYLMSIMAFQLKAVCLYCISSAVSSTVLFGLALVGHDWEDLGKILFTGLIVSMLTLLTVFGIYAHISTKPVSSDVAEVALAQHLTKVGAKMYGAYWCPHCNDQKEMFGKDAFSQVTYVECDPNGKNAQPQLCEKAKIKGYPTWELNGKQYSGTQTLNQLADISGYQGPRNFQSGSTPPAIPASPLVPAPAK